MSQRTIKRAVHDLIVENMGIDTSKVLVRYPRQLNIGMGPTIVVLWCLRARETRMAGSGRSTGPTHGVKQVPWRLQIHVVHWNQNVEDGDSIFEDFVDDLLELIRLNNVLPQAANPEEGSQVLAFGENMDIEINTPEFNKQYIANQAFITVEVLEMYNA